MAMILGKQQKRYIDAIGPCGRSQDPKSKHTVLFKVLQCSILSSQDQIPYVSIQSKYKHELLIFDPTPFTIHS